MLRQSICRGYDIAIITAQDFTLPGYFEAVDSDPQIDKHSIRYSDSGRSVQVPKGVFHYTETGQNIEGGFKVPNPGEELDPMNVISELMQTASKAQTDKKSMSGIYVPMPFGMRPLNFQLSQSGTNGMSFEDEAHAPTGEGLRRKEPENKRKSLNMSPEARSKLEEARVNCIGESMDECDKSLDEYFRTRFGTSPMDKVMKKVQATPSDPDQIAQTELASWLMPSLRDRLEEIQSEDGMDKNRVDIEPVRRSPRRSRRRRDFSRRFLDDPQREHKHRHLRVSKLGVIPRW